MLVGLTGVPMSHYKRRKPRRKVKCNLCTPHRVGNKGAEKKKQIKVADEKMKEVDDQ